MSETTELSMLRETLARVETKLDEMLAFRDLVLTFATAGAAKKAAMAAKLKFTGGKP